MEEIKVLVPEERVSEFYRWFADWSDGVFSGPGRASERSDGDAAEDPLPAAVAFWKTLRPKERDIWNLWIESAPNVLAAAEIVDRLGFSNAREIPGALSWSSRKAKKVGFRSDWRFRTDPISGSPVYGIEDEDYAKLLRQARDIAESSKR